MTMSSSHLSFTLSSDLRAQLMHVVVERGLWDSEALASFRTAILAEAEKFYGARTPFDVLADLRQFPVQTQETALNGRSTILDIRDKGLRRSAIVVGGMLAKLQIARMSGQDDHRFFTSPEEARAWLESH